MLPHRDRPGLHRLITRTAIRTGLPRSRRTALRCSADTRRRFLPALRRTVGLAASSSLDRQPPGQRRTTRGLSASNPSRPETDPPCPLTISFLMAPTDRTGAADDRLPAAWLRGSLVLPRVPPGSLFWGPTRRRSKVGRVRADPWCRRGADRGRFGADSGILPAGVRGAERAGIGGSTPVCAASGSTRTVGGPEPRWPRSPLITTPPFHRPPSHRDVRTAGAVP